MASSATPLSDIVPWLALYCHALAGHEVRVGSCRELVERSMGWFDATRATSDGETIYLPESVAVSSARAENLAWYQVLASQQVAVVLARGSHVGVQLHPRHHAGARGLLRERLKGYVSALGVPRASDDGSGWLAFCISFPRPELARRLLVLAECARLEAWLLRRYPGLEPLYQRARAVVLEEPRFATGNGEEARSWGAHWVRASLDPGGTRDVRGPLGEALQVWCAGLDRVRRAGATPPDAAEAALRGYVACQFALGADGASGYSAGSERPEALVDGLEQLWRAFLARGTAGGEAAFIELEPGAYHGALKPELVAAFARGDANDPLGVRRDFSERIAAEARRELGAELSLCEDELEDVVDGAVEELERRCRAAEAERGVDSAQRAADARLATEGDTEGWLYPEWDGRARCYRPDWCRVREEALPEDGGSFFDEVLARRQADAERIQATLAGLPPGALRRLRRQADGEDCDLDAAVEARIEVRRGGVPSERIYVRSLKERRSVATALLIDMSASTRNGADGAPAEAGTRVIDFEREAVVLLATALARVGDPYCVYGFSGYGRGNVRMYPILRWGEPLGKLRRRLDGVVPQYTTRLGAAIRHACSVVNQYPARERHLFVVCDGRPQDADYDRGSDDRHYALADTHMAFEEARCRNVTCCCLTLERQADEGFRRALRGSEFAVASELPELPDRLAELYRSLTAR